MKAIGRLIKLRVPSRETRVRTSNTHENIEDKRSSEADSPSRRTVNQEATIRKQRDSEAQLEYKQLMFRTNRAYIQLLAFVVAIYCDLDIIEHGLRDLFTTRLAVGHARVRTRLRQEQH